MSQPLSAWAKGMQTELDRWLAEPDPVKKAQLRAEWQKKLADHAKPKRDR
jgi:hypothetical protein